MRLFANATRVADHASLRAIGQPVHWNVMGHIGNVHAEVEALIAILSTRPKNSWETICEVGFNAGHSAVRWLHESRDDVGALARLRLAGPPRATPKRTVQPPRGPHNSHNSPISPDRSRATRAPGRSNRAARKPQPNGNRPPNFDNPQPASSRLPRHAEPEDGGSSRRGAALAARTPSSSDVGRRSTRASASPSEPSLSSTV